MTTGLLACQDVASDRRKWSVVRMISAEEVIARLRLTPLFIDCRFYREPSRTEHATSNFYQLAPPTSSLLHRWNSDEIYHFCLGDPVELLMLHSDGASEVRT